MNTYDLKFFLFPESMTLLFQINMQMQLAVNVELSVIVKKHNLLSCFYSLATARRNHLYP